MMIRLAALIWKELLANIRDPKVRYMMLLSPVLKLLLFTYTATYEVKNVNLAVVNDDHGAAATELISRFVGAPTFARVIEVPGMGDIAPSIDSQQVDAVLHIGPDFSRRLERGEPAQVQLLLDGRRSNMSQILAGYADTIVTRFSSEREAARAQQDDRAPVVPARLDVRTWFNPNLETSWSSVPGLFVIVTTVVGIMVSALAIARERELGTFEQLLVSPLRPAEIVVGKAVPALLLAVGEAALLLLVARFVLGVPVTGSVVLLFATMSLFLLSVIGIGLFISALCGTQQQAIIGAFLFMVPGFILSGFGSPVENMPNWLIVISEGNPIRHFVMIAQGLFLKDLPASVVWDHSWPLMLIAGITLSAAARLFRAKAA
jgi:ABC-2 type transport system permease protein